MIKILLLLFCLIASPAIAAWDFTADNVQVTDAANALDLPDADWTLCFRFKLDSNTGTQTQTLVANNSTYGNAGWVFGVSEASQANPNVSRHSVEDGGGNNYGGNDVIGSQTPGSSTAWQTWCAIRSSTTFTLYINNVQSATATNASVTSVTTGGSGLHFGQETDAGNPIDDGHIADFAIWPKAFTSGERAAYEKFAANCFPGMQTYIPAIRNYVELKNNLTVANTGTVASAHPPLVHCH